MRKVWAWMVAIISAIVALIGGFILYGRRQRSAGEAEGGYEEDRKRVQEDESAHDDNAVLEDWRKANK